MNLLASVATFFKEGGPFMYPILVSGVFAAALGAERAVVIGSAGRVRMEKLLARLGTALRAGNRPQALATCRSGDAPLLRVGSAILDQPPGLEAETNLQQSADTAASVQLAPLSRRLSMLVTLANVATLLGLLGTIFGLIVAFGAVDSADPAQRSAALARGIAQALNTTAFGLIIAVPTLTLHGLLVNKVEAIGDQVDEFSARLISLLTRHRDLA